MSAKAKHGKSGAPPSRTGSGATGRRWQLPMILAVLELLVVGAALVSLPAPREASVVDVAAVVAGLAGVVGGIAVVLVGRGVRVSRLAAAWSAFLLAALVSAVVSGRGWSAFMGQPTNLLGWGTLAAVTAVAFASATLRREMAEMLHRFAWVALLAEVVLVFARLSSGGPQTGTLPNSTIFGCVVLLLLPWTISPSWKPAAWEVLARTITAFLAVAALAMTGARAALLLAVVWATWTFIRSASWSRRTKVVAVLGIITVAFAFAALYAGAEFSASFSASTLGDRPEIWKMGSHAVVAKPILGYGPDGFVSGVSAISTVGLARREKLLMVGPGATDPHNLLVWVAVSTGLLGLATFLCFLAETGLSWRASQREAVAITPAVWGVAMCAVVYLSAPAALQTLPLFALLFGLSVPSAAALSGTESASRSNWIRPALGVALALTSAVFALDAATRAPLENANRAEPPATALRAQSASNVWVFDAHLAYLASQHWGYALAAEPTLAQTKPDLIAIRRAVALDGRDPFYATELARTVAFYGEPQASVASAFQEALRRYPAYPVARAAYAEWLARQGRLPEAKQQLEIAQLVNGGGSPELEASLKAARDAIAASPGQ